MAKNFIGMGNLAQICSNEMNAVSLPGFSMLPTLMRRRNLIALDCLVNDLCKSVTLVCLKKEPPEFTAV